MASLTTAARACAMRAARVAGLPRGSAASLAHVCAYTPAHTHGHTTGIGMAMQPLAAGGRWAGAASRTFATRSEVSPPSEEAPVGAAEKLSFQAETRQLLNIVTNSLYSDKHVFVRELVSNASDALEKARHKQVAGEALLAPDTPLQIRINTDESTGTLTISDSGIGMARAELVDHLGTIARSGSRAFLQAIRDKAAAGAQGGAAAAAGADTGVNIIGQFGVGFYSVFMVADSVRVFTQSAVPGEESKGWCWTSAGDGSYEISEATGVSRGTKIVIKLKEACREFANPATVKDIITRYSNFVNFPIILNGSQVNTVGALWTRSKEEVTEQQYADFYKYKSGDFEAPLYRLHFSSDAPIALKALLFVGRSHEEKYGMGRIRPGVDLYSRRVLIEAGSRIMPDWLRFVHGVVDSEDIPLNVSRETMQDSALVKRLRSVLTRRMLRFFESEARRDPEAYNQKFFAEFGNFLKEGAVTDSAYGPDIAKLLRFESSALPAGTLTSFDEYVSRMSPGQQSIYYLVAPHRGIAETSPYLEAFKGARKAAGGEADDVEVLFLYSSIDDFVMNNLREFNGRKLMTAESADVNPDTLKGVSDKADGDKKEQEATTAAAALTTAQVEELGTWLVSALPKKVAKVRATTRLKSSPAVVTEHESAAVRRMMRLVEQSAGRDSESLKAEAHMLPPQTLEINPSHPIITGLYRTKATAPAVATLVAEQLLDNALIAAGLMDDSRTLLPRLNALLEQVLAPGAAVPESASAAKLSERRHVPESEKQEKAALDLGQAVYEQFAKDLEQGAAAAAAKKE